MPNDPEYEFESPGGRPGQSWGWQDWGVYAAFVLIAVATVLLTSGRSPIGVLVIVAAATVLLIAIGARRLREGGRTPRSGEGQ